MGTANFDNIQLIAFSFAATLFGSKEEIIGKCNVMKLSPVSSFRIFFQGKVEKESRQMVQAGLKLHPWPF